MQSNDVALSDAQRRTEAHAQLELALGIVRSPAQFTGGNPAKALVAALQRTIALTSPTFERDTWLRATTTYADFLNDPASDAEDSREQALILYESAMRETTLERDGKLWADIRASLATLYLHRVAGPIAENFTRAIACAQVALSFFDKQHYRATRINLLNLLGSAYRQSTAGRKSDNIELALRAYNEALPLYLPEERVEYAQTVSNIGNALSERIQYDRADNLEQAIAAFTGAIGVFREKDRPFEWAMTLTNLAGTCLDRLLGDRSDNAKKAIDACDGALSFLEHQPGYAWINAMRYRGLAYRRVASADRSQTIELACGDLARVCLALDKRRQQSDAAPAVLAQSLLDYGNALLERIQGDRDDNLKRALQCALNARAIVENQQRVREMGLTYLLIARIDYASRIREPTLLEEAFTLYAHAIDLFRRVEAMPDIVEAAGEFADALAENKLWEKSTVQYRVALEARESLIMGAVSYVGRSAELAANRNLEHRAAYALAQSGDAAFAAVVLERSRARWLNDMLDRESGDMERLEKAFPKEYAAYLKASQQFGSLHAMNVAETFAATAASIDRNAWKTDIYNAEVALRQAQKVVAALPGFAHAFDFPDFEEISQAVQTEYPVIYIVSTAFGGMALVLMRSDAGTATIESLWLPLYTEKLLSSLTEAWLPALQSKTPARDIRAAIDWSSTGLWEAILAPLHERLTRGSFRGARIIAGGVLSLFPLHAIRGSNLKNEIIPAERSITFAPSARALTRAMRDAVRIANDSVLVVSDPQPVRASPLLWAPVEAAAIASTFGSRARNLAGVDATRANVRAVLGGHAVVHFSCHAFSDLSAPLASGAALANNEIFRVADLFETDFGGGRLATLSACETATIGAALPDEAVSLAVGFVRAGFAGVIASLWPVDDRATAMLMARFYERWRVGNVSLTDALHEAQCWMRDTTNREKAAYFSGLLTENGGDGSFSEASAESFFQALALENPNERSHEHPYYWAAFTLMGV